jgi:ATP-binding cassette subfamily B protein
MKDLLRWLLRYKSRVLVGFLSLLIVDGAGLVIPLVIKNAIDQLARGEGDLFQSGVQIAALAVIAMVFRFFWRYFLIGTARRIERDLRGKLYQHFLTLPASFYNERKTGDLMAHATNDIEAVSQACGFGVITIADPLFMIPVAVGIMLTIAPWLTLYAILPLPILTLFMLSFGRVIHRRFERVQETFAEIMEKVRENVAGIRVIKSFIQEEGTNRDFNRANQQLVDKNMALVRVWGLFHPLIELLSGASLAIILWVGGRGVVLGSISLGDFVAFSQYLMILTWPMIALGQAVNVFQRGSASLSRINRLLASAPLITDPSHPKALNNTQIAIRNLTFSYPSHNGDNEGPVLTNLNLTVEEGMTLGIVGLTGSGKSTLVHLIPRVFDPPPATILIGGDDVREIALADLRRAIGFVPQDPFLFSSTIRENIAFGSPEATDAQIEEAAHLAGIHDEIVEFTKGYHTMVGERGISLSGGQKQRVAIARALLLDPKILILDDPLSAVDAEKEELILKNLKAFYTKKTSLIIAHRISAVMHADRIIVLDGGEIVESGTHDQLIAAEGIYRRLWNLQQLERRRDAR